MKNTPQRPEEAGICRQGCARLWAMQGYGQGCARLRTRASIGVSGKEYCRSVGDANSYHFYTTLNVIDERR